MEDTTQVKQKTESSWKIKCLSCGKECRPQDLYYSSSDLFSSTQRIPYCRSCIKERYDKTLKYFKNHDLYDPQYAAIQRMCQVLDMVFNDKAYSAALKTCTQSKNKSESLMFDYLKTMNLNQYKIKHYDSSFVEIDKKNTELFRKLEADQRTPDEKEKEAKIKKSISIFGNGIGSKEDYLYLLEQYEDWISRHECNSKSQEEIFKRLSLNQLKSLKATVRGEDTKDLDTIFQKLLDSGKLQPKQNHSETSADVQSFGSLIDKWESTRPIPEVDEDLKDVDKIGLYLDVFFKGHLAKMMGLKNGLSNLYNKFMEKYTVKRPEYDDDEDGEALFDAIFGNNNLEDEL